MPQLIQKWAPVLQELSKQYGLELEPASAILDRVVAKVVTNQEQTAKASQEANAEDNMKLTIREAKLEDASKLAHLMNIAGEGIPAYLWERMASPGEDVMTFGTRRVAQPEGGFSYTNAYVAVSADEIIGMLLGYRLPDPHDVGPLDEVPAVVRPLVELEALAPGSWYINAIATDAEYRGKGAGRMLMGWAEQLAESSGAETLSLIVAEENAGALRLYEKLGYQTIARRPIVTFAGCPHTGDWVLMEKPIELSA